MGSGAVGEEEVWEMAMQWVVAHAVVEVAVDSKYGILYCGI